MAACKLMNSTAIDPSSNMLRLEFDEPVDLECCIVKPTSCNIDRASSQHRASIGWIGSEQRAEIEHGPVVSAISEVGHAAQVACLGKTRVEAKGFIAFRDSALEAAAPVGSAGTGEGNLGANGVGRSGSRRS